MRRRVCAEPRKKTPNWTSSAFIISRIEGDNSNHVGRGERAQTFDLSVPNRARYQLRHTPMVF